MEYKSLFTVFILLFSWSEGLNWVITQHSTTSLLLQIQPTLPVNCLLLFFWRHLTHVLQGCSYNGRGTDKKKQPAYDGNIPLNLVTNISYIKVFNPHRPTLPHTPTYTHNQIKSPLNEILHHLANDTPNPTIQRHEWCWWTFNSTMCVFITEHPHVCLAFRLQTLALVHMSVCVCVCLYVS